MERHGVCELLHRCARRRCEDDWAELIRSYGPRLDRQVRWTLCRCGLPASDERTEEMLQEVYCRLLERDGQRLLACRGRTRGEIDSYLSRVAARVVVDQVRQNRAVKRGHDRLAEGAVPPAVLSEGPPDPSSSPEEALLAREGARRLLARFGRAEIGTRGRRNLRILVLAAVGGWTSGEISRALGGALGPSGVDSLLARVKRRLRQTCPVAV